MELDDLKSAWHTLDRRLQQQAELNLHVFRESKLDRVRKGLRRLYWGMIAQILFGDALIYFGIMATIRHHETPHLLACSVFLLAYGVLTVVFGGVVLGMVGTIDYSAPVLDIAKRVARLRRLFIVSSWCLGLPWWFLWIAIFVLEMKAMVGVDLFVSLPAFIWINGLIGAAGFIATIVYFRWRDARRAGQPDGSDIPRGLRDAKTLLEDIARFEKG